MRRVGLFEAKQKLSELVESASHGEQIGITKRGKLAALIVSPVPVLDLKQTFAAIEKIRQNTKSLGGLTIKDLIEEGRR